MATAVQYAKGLEGVIAGESKICKIVGEEGKLFYRGYSVRDLVDNVSFEDTVYLLLYGELPDGDQSAAFSKRIRTQRKLPPAVVQMVSSFPKDAHPMELLQSSIAYLSSYIDHKIHHSPTCNCRSTLHQVSQLATVIAAHHRVYNGENPVDPDPTLSHGANFLYMLRGERPSEREGQIMDACFIMHAEHSFNASTFTARVVASTNSTCYSSISAAIGALYGNLHGGANEAVIKMVEEIGDPEHAAEWTTMALNEKRKVMGMGHRVYKAKDPRAIIMESFLKELSETTGNMKYYNILKTVEKTFRDKMEEKGKPIYPNVDFFSGAVYTLLGIPSRLFTPIFAAARVSGWLAHILEQREDNRIFRPKALYVGPEPREVLVKLN